MTTPPWVPNCVPNGESDATIKCLDVYFFQYSANKEATVVDSFHYNDPSLNGMSDASAVFCATTLLGTEINGYTRKYFVFRETGWDFATDPYKILFYDSLDTSLNAVSVGYCSTCPEYQFTQFFCMKDDLLTVTSSGIPLGSLFDGSAGTVNNRIALAPHYLLYSNESSWAKNGTSQVLGPGESNISNNPNACQIPASWYCDGSGGPIPPRLWSRGYNECVDVSTEKLNMRRKAETLLYKNNESKFTARQKFSQLVKGHGRYRKRCWASQNIQVTNPNTSNLTEKNQFTLLCPNTAVMCGLTSSADVPGPIQTLCMEPGVPLTRWIPRRTYRAGGSKYPEWKWEPGMNGFPRGKSGNFLVFK